MNQPNVTKLIEMAQNKTDSTNSFAGMTRAARFKFATPDHAQSELKPPPWSAYPRCGQHSVLIGLWDFSVVCGGMCGYNIKKYARLPVVW